MNRSSLYLYDLTKRRKTSNYLREFERTKHLNKEDLKEYQLSKLKKLLIHASENVPFYKQRFKENNFSPEKLQTFDHLLEIPPLTRQDLQNNWENIIAGNHFVDLLSRGSSSGATGVPVIYYKDKLTTSAGHAAHYIGWGMSGWKMQYKGLHIWGNPSTVNNEWNKLSSKVKAFLFSQHKFPAYTLSDGNQFQVLLEKIIKNKYDYIDGYTNAIYLFASYLKEKQIILNSRIKFVFTTAENLHEYQKRTIEEQIGPVYDSYGCSEINSIAYQCDECSSYHIMDPHVYLEFGDKVDEIGSHELIITDLDNYAFPLIRYKNDDLGIPVRTESPSCPRNFSQMDKVSGRESDIIRFKDGGTLSVPSFFGSMLLKQINGLLQYQIEMIDHDYIIIKLVKSKEYSEKDHSIIENALTEYLSTRIRYEIRFVEKIEISKSGKFKLLVDRTKST